MAASAPTPSSWLSSTLLSPLRFQKLPPLQKPFQFVSLASRVASLRGGYHITLFHGCTLGFIKLYQEPTEIISMAALPPDTNAPQPINPSQTQCLDIIGLFYLTPLLAPRDPSQHFNHSK